MSNFAVPDCTLLKKLDIHVLNSSCLRLLKLIISKAKNIENLVLEDIQEKCYEIEIPNDSLETIELRKMEKLGCVKLKGKARPLKIGFQGTKFLLNKK